MNRPMRPTAVPQVAGESLISLDAVTIGHRRRPLLGPLSWHIHRGEIWGVVGPNGAGKTTLVKTLVGLLPPLDGRLVRHQESLCFGYVPQRHVLNPTFPLRVFDVVLMGRTAAWGLFQGPGRVDRSRVEEELVHLGLSALARRRFGDLSGGEKQRVLVARALVADPDLLVLDEPTEGVDLGMEAEIFHLLQQIRSQRNIAILMVGHHMSEVASVVDRLCLVDQHKGFFEAGSAQELLSAARLTSLYGREVEIHQCSERTFIHVKD